MSDWQHPFKGYWHIAPNETTILRRTNQITKEEIMNPYELSDKREQELSQITAKMRQDAYRAGYAEGYKDGLARFVPEVDTVPIPKAPIQDSPAEWAKGDR